MMNDVKSGNAASDGGVEHLKPEGTTLGSVELSIVIPAMMKKSLWANSLSGARRVSSTPE